MRTEIGLAFAISFALGLGLTLVCERVAQRGGVVARPAADRWHRTTIPLLGGVGIVIATLGPVLATTHGDRRFLVLALASLAMASVGLIDDVRALRPQAKLLAQIVLAVTLLQFGFALRLTGIQVVDVLVTLVWIVGITNAFNLLDNMDGLSATIALVAGGFRLLFFLWDGDRAGAQVTAMFMGALAGFLVRNFSPAKIFMGDAGSLFIGFFLSGLSLIIGDWPYSRGVVAVLVIPVLLLLIPIFDTAFVTTTRLLSGRSVAAGGRDHTSHRLIAVGLSERQTVLLLAALSAAAGGVAALSYRAGLSQSVVLLALLVIVLVLLGIHLSRVRVVERAESPNGGTVFRLLADFQYKRQVLALSLDVCLIMVAYYAAYVIRFEESLGQHFLELRASLPTVLLSQLLTLAAFGLYRGIWRYTGISDLLRIVKAATVGTMIAVIILVYSYHFAGFSRTVFILDWLLLIVLLSGTRASFRFFVEVFRPASASFVRVLIYGAGDGGELIVRELLNNPSLQRVPVGFIDDDRTKHQTRIHGLPILGGSDQVATLVPERGVGEIIISSAKIKGNGLAHVTRVCGELAIPVRQASLRLE